jgi:hypothetical protein
VEFQMPREERSQQTWKANLGQVLLRDQTRG